MTIATQFFYAVAALLIIFGVIALLVAAPPTIQKFTEDKN